jgi:hypothetical protein
MFPEAVLNDACLDLHDVHELASVKLRTTSLSSNHGYCDRVLYL